MWTLRRLLPWWVALLSACSLGGGSATVKPVCCPITDDPIPGGCVSLGGAADEASNCVGVCDSFAPLVRIVDEGGCPKLVNAGCVDAAADAEPAVCR